MFNLANKGDHLVRAVDGSAAARTGPLAILAADTPEATADEARRLARTHYGLDAEATPLRSERDQNFLLRAKDGSCFVLKLSNPAQDPAVAQMQSRALDHIQQVDPALPVPRVVPTLSERWEFGWTAANHAAGIGRLVTYLPGKPLAEFPLTLPRAAQFGRSAARLGRALRGFFDPAADHELLWDLKHAGRLAELVPLISDPADRRQVVAALDRFEHRVAPRLPGLRAQLIHNDLNPHNVLVRTEEPDGICGIIDFGDMVHGALVNDVAIGAAYLMTTGDDPVAVTCAFVAGYSAVTPLEPEEVDLLPDLIATRHALTIAITAWRASRFPENAAYILRNRTAAALGAETLAGFGREALASRLRAACGLE